MDPQTTFTTELDSYTSYDIGVGVTGDARRSSSSSLRLRGKKDPAFLRARAHQRIYRRGWTLEESTETAAVRMRCSWERQAPQRLTSFPSPLVAPTRVPTHAQSRRRCAKRGCDEWAKVAGSSEAVHSHNSLCERSTSAPLSSSFLV